MIKALRYQIIVYLTLFLGLSSFFIKFDPNIDIPYFILFLFESIICVYYIKRNRVIHKLILLDFIFFILTQTIIPFLINFEVISYKIRLTIFEYSSNYYQLILINRSISVHAIAFGFLTFGKITSISKVLYTSFFVFFIASLFNYTIELSFDSIVMFISAIGVANYLVYLILSKKEKINLAFKKEVLFLFYFIGFSLGLLEYFPLFDDSANHISTSYNYVLYLFLAVIIILSPEKKLYHLVHNTFLKVIFLIIATLVSYFDYQPQIYYLQRIFLLLMLTMFLFLSEESKYYLKKVNT